MGIPPTLLPVSPTALVRPAFSQSHLHPLPGEDSLPPPEPSCSFSSLRNLPRQDRGTLVAEAAGVPAITF